MRIFAIVLLSGLFVNSYSLIPAIPMVAKVVGLSLLYFRQTFVSFITGPFDRYFERRADHGAVFLMQNQQRALKIAKAGQQYFSDKAHANLVKRNKAIASGGLSGLWMRLNINEKGENRLDFIHPGYMERITTFKSAEKQLHSKSL